MARPDTMTRPLALIMKIGGTNVVLVSYDDREKVQISQFSSLAQAQGGGRSALPIHTYSTENELKVIVSNLNLPPTCVSQIQFRL